MGMNRVNCAWRDLEASAEVLAMTRTVTQTTKFSKSISQSYNSQSH